MDKPLKFFLLFSIVFLGLLLVFNLAILKDRSLQQKEAQLDPDDPLLVKAKEKATETIDTLFELYPRFPENTFVKLAYTKKDESTIHLWAKVLRLERDHAELEIEVDGKSENHYLPVEQIEDWLVETGNGKVRGGFTTQVILIREKQNNKKSNTDSLLQNFLDPIN